MLLLCGTTLLGFIDSPGNAEQSVDGLSCHLFARAFAAVQVLQIWAGASHKSLIIRWKCQVRKLPLLGLPQKILMVPPIQHISMCVEATQWAGKTKHCAEEALVLATVPSLTGRESMISLLGFLCPSGQAKGMLSLMETVTTKSSCARCRSVVLPIYSPRPFL